MPRSRSARAAVFEVEEAVRRVDDRHAEAEAGVDLQRGADAAAADHVDEGSVCLQEAAPERLHGEHVSIPRCSDHRSRGGVAWRRGGVTCASWGASSAGSGGGS